MTHFIGIDVGTGSARAGVFDATGRLLGFASAAITTFRPAPDFAQQSSAEIWAAVCTATKRALRQAGAAAGGRCGGGLDGGGYRGHRL